MFVGVIEDETGHGIVILGKTRSMPDDPVRSDHAIGIGRQDRAVRRFACDQPACRSIHRQTAGAAGMSEAGRQFAFHNPERERRAPRVSRSFVRRAILAIVQQKQDAERTGW